MKEKNVKKGIKCEENTDDIKIKHEYKVPSNCQVQESKSKKTYIKVKVKKMELRQHSKGSTDKIFLSSPVKKRDKKETCSKSTKERKKEICK